MRPEWPLRLAQRRGRHWPSAASDFALWGNNARILTRWPGGFQPQIYDKFWWGAFTSPGGAPVSQPALRQSSFEVRSPRSETRSPKAERRPSSETRSPSAVRASAFGFDPLVASPSPPRDEGWGEDASAVFHDSRPELSSSGVIFQPISLECRERRPALPTLSSKGGREGHRVAAGEHRDACKVPSKGTHSRQNAGFQTGLERVGGLVDTLPPEHTLSRFGNRRSARVPGTRACVHCGKTAGAKKDVPRA